jgi:YfiH family protein
MGFGLKYKNKETVFEEKIMEGVPLLTYPLLEKTEFVTHGFTTRMGGVSEGYCSTMNISTTRGDDPKAIEENQRRLARALGVRVEDFTYTHQTHTTNVAVVREEDRGKRFMETDGMVTDVPGICLVTFYADCVPLYFVDPVHRAIGLSHSGWRGTVKRMGQVTLERMKEAYGTKPEDVFAAIGPSICQDCYEVSGDVIEEFRENFSEFVWSQLFYEKENGKYQLNLWRANQIVLTEAGVEAQNIAVTNLCTHCNPEILFSHRSTGVKRGNLSALLAIKREENN